MEQPGNNKPTQREKILAGVSIALVMILLPLSETIRANAPDQISKLVAGFILGSYGAVGYAMTVRLVKAARAGELLNTIDTTKWMRPFSLFVIVFLIIFGLLAWYVSWEGKTGMFYGLGVAIGGALAEGGVGSILKSGK